MNNIDTKIKILKRSYASSVMTLVLAAGAIVVGTFISMTFIVAGILLFVLFASGLYSTYKANKELDAIAENARSNRVLALSLTNRLISNYSMKQANNELKANTSRKDRDDSLKDARNWESRIKILLEIRDILDGDSFE